MVSRFGKLFVKYRHSHAEHRVSEMLRAPPLLTRGDARAGGSVSGQPGPFLPDRGSWICGRTIFMERRWWDERAGRRQLWNTGQRTVSFEETGSARGRF